MWSFKKEDELISKRDKALLSLGYCVGKEAGHHETVEGDFTGSGRPEWHIEAAVEFVSELTIDDIDYAMKTYEEES